MSCLAYRFVPCIALFATAATAQLVAPGDTRWSQDQFVEYVIGNAPIVISAGHGGSLQPGWLPDRTYGTFAKDTRTIELAREFAAHLEQRFALRPHLILCHLHRDKIDVNRDVVEGAQGNPQTIAAYQAFHQAIVDARTSAQNQWGFGFYFDLHGHGHPEGWIELGYDLTATQLALPDSTLANPAYVAQSTIRSAGSLPSIWFPGVLRGPTSLGGHLQSGGYDSVPSPVNPHPNGGNYFDGGFNVANYGSKLGGTVDGVQIETPWSVRSSLAVRGPFAARVGSWLDLFFSALRGTSLGTGNRITLVADDRSASETGGTAELVLRRTGDLGISRIVILRLGGTATAGVDYVAPGVVHSFAIGQTELRVPIHALDDQLAEGDEVIEVAVVGGTDTGVQSRAEIVIRDDEVGEAAELRLPLASAVGGSTPDLSGNGHQGQLLPAGASATVGAGPPGSAGALWFDGIDDRLRVGDWPYAPGGAFSVSFWFRTSNTAGTGFRYLLSHGGLAANHRLGVYLDQSNGTLRTALIYGNDLTTLDALDVTRDLRDGQWHHYALVAPAFGLARVYLDGVATTAALYLGDTIDPTGDLVFGARSDLATSTFAAVALADVRVYARSLAAVEVQLLAAPALREEAVYPGTNEGLALATGVANAPSSGPRLDVKAIAGGQGAVVTYAAADPARLGRVAALLAELRGTGAPVVHPVFAGVHVVQPILAHGPVVLGPAGATWLWLAPPGFAGLSVQLQVVALDGSAANGLFAASDSHELRLQ